MEQFMFYLQLGLEHVLDLSAYDHILFLAALAAPFLFREWKKVVLLATVFTIAHCLSLALSAYGIIQVNVALIEFLIPVTIFLTAMFNLSYVRHGAVHTHISLHLIATTFFGLIHGCGFSNYFNMLMAEEENKLTPLAGFASGIELSQLVIILLALALGYILTQVFKIKRTYYIMGVSFVVILITIPMLMDTYPW